MSEANPAARMRRAGPRGRAAAAAAAPGSAVGRAKLSPTTVAAALLLLLLAALAAPMPAAAQGPPALACAPGKCKPRKPTGATSPVPGKKTWMTKQNKAMNAFGLSKAMGGWADSYLAWHPEHEQWICHCTSACDHGVCDVLVDTRSSAGVQPTGQICADIETAYGPAPKNAPKISFNTINCGNPPFTKHIVDSFNVPDEVWCPGRVDAPNKCGQIGLGWDLSFYAGWKGTAWGASYAPQAIGDTPEVLWRPRWHMLDLLLSTKTAGRKSRGCYPAAAAADFVAATTVEDVPRKWLPWLADAGDGMTLDRCKQYCIATSVEDKARPAYKFFALQSGGTCSCSASSPGPPPAGAAGACDVPCEGDAGQTCGGGGHLSVYAITGLPKKWLKAPESPAPAQASGALGCFSDSADDRLLDGPSFKSGSMTLAACQSFCATSGDHSHFGTEFGKECYCGALPPDAANIAAGSCDTPCKGNAAEDCGGADAINVFHVADFDPSAAVPEAPPPSAAVPEAPPPTSDWAGSGPRPRPQWEKDIVDKYTFGAAGGWADPTPGGCDKPMGPVCGPWRQEPIPYSAGKQKYAMKHVKKHKVMKKWKLPDDGTWYESKARSAAGFTKIPGRGRPEMKWYRDSYAVYHPELDRYVCHCMSNGKPGCTFLDPETGTYVKDAAAWKAPPFTDGRIFGCQPGGEYNGCYDFGVETPIGEKRLDEVCQDIEATFGPGPVANRIFFNTIQCGHGGFLHRHGHGIEDFSVFDQAYIEDGIELEAVCPGVIGRYTKKGKWKEVYGACGLVGPAFELETVYADGQDPDGIPVKITGVAVEGDGTTGSKFVHPDTYPPY